MRKPKHELAVGWLVGGVAAIGVGWVISKTFEASPAALGSADNPLQIQPPAPATTPTPPVQPVPAAAGIYTSFGEVPRRRV